MKERLVYIIMFALFFTVYSCTKEYKISSLKPEPLQTVKEFHDSTFLSGSVMCMDVMQNDIVLTDYNMGQVIVLDSNLIIKQRIGETGAGLNEFVRAEKFSTLDDKLYVINDGGNHVKVFEKYNFRYNINFPQNITLTTWTRFFCFNNQIYHSVISKETPAISFDVNGITNNKICNYTDIDNASLPFHSSRHLIKGENSFFVIAKVLPIFEEYNMEYKKIKSFDLSTIEDVESIVKKYKNTQQYPDKYFVMIQDVFYSKNKVFLLLASSIDMYSCNKIIVLSVKNEIKQIAAVELTGKVYLSFCVKNDKLFAFNALNAQIEAYKLPILN